MLNIYTRLWQKIQIKISPCFFLHLIYLSPFLDIYLTMSELLINVSFLLVFFNLPNKKAENSEFLEGIESLTTSGLSIASSCQLTRSSHVIHLKLCVTFIPFKATLKEKKANMAEAIQKKLKAEVEKYALMQKGERLLARIWG